MMWPIRASTSTTESANLLLDSRTCRTRLHPQIHGGYPPGAYEAVKGYRRTPSPEPRPVERTNPGPERLHRADERTSRAAEGTRRWIERGIASIVWERQHLGKKRGVLL